METNTEVKAKAEPIANSLECTTLIPNLQSYYTYSCFEIDHNNAENDVNNIVVEEKHVDVSVPTAEIKIDGIGAIQNLSDIEIARNHMNIKIDFSENDNLLNYWCSTKLLREEENVSKSGLKASVNREGNCCEIFNKNWTTKNSILKHMTIRGNGRYKCKICWRCFKTRKITLNYLKLQFEKSRHDVAVCQRKKYVRTNKESYKCDICIKLFTRTAILLKHMKQHTNESNYKCEICNKHFATKKYLLKHLKMHSNDRNYKCEICKKYFQRKFTFLQHMTIHIKKQNYKCEVCSKFFTEKHNMLKHARSHTSERIYKCENCNRCFSNKGHMLRHTCEKDYKCDVCNKCFRRKANMLNHLKLHTDERNYECEICNKRFVTKRRLSNHVAIHSSERNYKCEICTKCFSTKAAVVSHIKLHTNERNYKCEFCDKCFKAKRYMLRHAKLHTSERNHKCEICAKCFSTKTTLSTHVKASHASERNYKCEICNKCFTMKRYMVLHMRRHDSETTHRQHAKTHTKLLEYKVSHTEENVEEASLRKFSLNIPSNGNIEKKSIKEEIVTSIKEESEIDNDLMETKPSTSTNEYGGDSAFIDENSKSTEILDLWQTFKHDIVIKEENTIPHT